MNQQAKSLVLLMFAQAACLALGLWLESRFLDSLAENRVLVGPSASESNAAITTSAEGPADHALNENAALTWKNPARAMRVMSFVWIAGLQGAVAYLILMRLRAESSRRQVQAAQESVRRQNDLLRTRDAMIFGLAKLTESRDPETGNHLERIARYSTRLAAALRRRPGFAERITPSFVRLIGISSALHDIGKVGISDSILLKPGKLDPEERSVMQRHAVIGGQCIRKIEMRLGSSNFLEMAREIAFHHHERWDGQGYPEGLQGEQIPLAARIVAVADVYDALSTKRVYKEAFPHERCVQTIREEAGRQFDPALVEVFLAIHEDFRDIAERRADAAEVAAAERTAAEEGPQAASAVAEGSDEGLSFPVVLTEQNPVESPLALP